MNNQHLEPVFRQVTRYTKFWIPLILALASLLLAGDKEASVDRLDDVNRLGSPYVFPRQPVRLLLQEGFDTVEVGGVRGLGDLLVEAKSRSIAVRRSGISHPLGSGFRLQPEQDGSLTFKGRRYRGFLEAFINPLGVPVLVNEIGLEDYLRAVLPNELNPRLFPEPEALKAQAVAARTYALAELGRRGRHGFDLYADERSQVYAGAGFEQVASDEAIRATSGIVAGFSNAPITAFYSSTCGGVTASYETTFQAAPIPYLKGGAECPDEGGRYRRWRREVPAAEIQARLDARGGPGTLTKVEILGRDRHGRALKVRFEGSQGEIVMRGLDARQVMGLRSHFITKLELTRNKQGRLASVKVEGRGFGHGVGMCQIGAVELAKRGLSYEAILRHYYPGIELVEVY